MKKTTKLGAREITTSAILMALSIILTRTMSVMLPIPGLAEGLRVGFGTIPIQAGGYLFGPLAGGLVGLGADLIGYMINPMGGALHLGFTLSSVLSGVIPGIISRAYAKSSGKTILEVLREGRSQSIIIGSTNIIRAILIESFLNTIWLTQLYGTPFMAIFFPRLAKALIVAVIYFIVMRILMAFFTNKSVSRYVFE